MSQHRRLEQPAQLTTLQRFLSNSIVTGIGMFFSKYLPPSVGYATASLIAGLINWLRPDVYWIVHANLRQAVGSDVNGERLHHLVRKVFGNSARNDYDLWHLVGQRKERIRAAVHIPAGAWNHIDQAVRRGKGMIFVGTHTGNFDLTLLALAAHGLEMQVLGLAAPPTGGFHLMDEMRASAGVEATSISIPALRQAIKRLRSGGLVVTGVDRPVGDTELLTEFFGRPAPLPSGHVRLALKTDAAILIAGPHRDPQKGNAVRISPPLEMIRTGDRDEDLQVNLQRVTAWLEKFIRASPDQWAMFMPVWPE